MSVGPRASEHRAERVIAIAAVGHADPAVVRHLHAVLGDTFARRVVDAPPLPLDPRAYRPARRQWLATALLDALGARRGAARRETVLGIAEVDLFVPDLNF